MTNIKNFKWPLYTIAQAKYKIMELMATRDHSLIELKKKIKHRCDKDTLDKVLQWAEQQTWFPSDEKIQEQVIRALGKKRKGIKAINLKMKELGLKSVQISVESEIEKALDLLNIKYKKIKWLELNSEDFFKNKSKALRFLLSRGFENSTATESFKRYYKNIKTYSSNYRDKD